MDNKIKTIFPGKIRFQLPLSYVAITLLVTLLIGVCMLFIIGRFYQNMEQDYLKENAGSIADSISMYTRNNRVGSDNPLENYRQVLQNQAEATAFLIQARVRILDRDGNVIADSGTPSQAWTIHLPSDTEKTPAAGQPGSNLQADDQGPPISFSPARNPPPPRGENRSMLPFDFSASRNLFGFILSYTDIDTGKRSSLKSEAVYYDHSRQPLGMVEISEGPEYGGGILNNVMQGWAIASLIAVLIAGLAGWLVSRQIIKPIVALEQATAEMKEGNLAARAPLLKPAELASLSDTFNQMADRIETNIQTLHRFVSDAAHELRTPLTALRADLDMATNEKEPAKMLTLVTRSLEQVTHLEQLSRNLLDLSRIETRNVLDTRQCLNLADLLLKTSEVQASVAEQAGIDFHLELPENPLVIRGSDVQLQQAINNMLENAVKFSAAGGSVIVSLQKDGRDAFMTIEDHGIGIPAEDRDYLFNRFYRGRNTHSYRGSGLGLAIAKAIIEQHGGSIGLLPDKTCTRFFIRLPLEV